MSHYYHHQLAERKSKRMLFLAITGVLSIAIMLLFVTSAQAKKSDDSGTTVPGHARYDADGNGSPDAGVYVNGHYTSVYAYDASGDYYWDLGDGRIDKTVESIENLEQSTLTTCDYVINYRADFGNNPGMDQGWIQNHINCSGYDDNSKYNYLIVSEEDHRYTGNDDLAIWGNWEYHVLTQSGDGNLVKVGPQNHVQ